MDKFVIEGGIPLKGEVEISGAKNAALPILTATILTKKECVIKNVPRLRDIETIKKLLGGLGAEIKDTSGGISLKTAELTSFDAPYELVKTMRASVLLLGPLIARGGRARVSLPGGCAIGARPINLHLDGLKKLGVKIDLDKGYIDAKATRLKGNRISFDLTTVTGTTNIMMAAIFADGETVIENAAMEPEVTETAKFLKKMGAKIEGEGTKTITIQGVSSLGGADWEIISDRIETGTYMTAAAMTGGEILIKNTFSGYLDAVIQKFVEAGVRVDLLGDRKIKVTGQKEIRSVDISTSPYPGFPTDMQAQFMALMTLANGSSVISENIFEGRFMHAAELIRMGADIKIKGGSCVVKGVSKLHGAPVMATDLRASASLVIAGLAAEGTTEVKRMYHLDRGYEKMEKKLSSLGANVTRLKDVLDK